MIEFHRIDQELTSNQRHAIIDELYRLDITNAIVQYDGIVFTEQTPVIPAGDTDFRIKFSSVYNLDVRSTQLQPSANWPNVISNSLDIDNLNYGQGKQFGPMTLVGELYHTFCDVDCRQFRHTWQHVTFCQTLVLPLRRLTHLLNLLLIPGLSDVNLCITDTDPNIHNTQGILDYHMQNGRDVIACQSDLIDAGLARFATL